MRLYRFVPLLGLALIGLAAGCAKGPPMADVEGVVTLGGKPLDNIHVEFNPEASGGVRSSGVTDASGRYTLKSDDGKRSGAVVGSHKIVLRDNSVIGKLFGRAGEGKDLSQGRKSRISLALTDVTKTPIQKTVNSGKNDIPIDAGAAGPAEGGR